MPTADPKIEHAEDHAVDAAVGDVAVVALDQEREHVELGAEQEADQERADVAEVRIERVEDARHGAADRHGRHHARREDVIDDEADRDAREQQTEAERRLQLRRLGRRSSPRREAAAPVA